MSNPAIPTVQIDNDRFRATEWRFAPEAETGEHVHEIDYVFIPGISGKLIIVAPDGSENSAELTEGVSHIRPAGVHQNVINSNDFEFSFVEVELK